MFWEGAALPSLDLGYWVLICVRISSWANCSCLWVLVNSSFGVFIAACGSLWSLNCWFPRAWKILTWIEQSSEVLLVGGRLVSPHGLPWMCGRPALKLLVFYLFHKLISVLFFHPLSSRYLFWCRCGNFLMEWCAPATFRYWSGCKNWTCYCSYHPRSCFQIYCLWLLILLYLIYFYVL